MALALRGRVVKGRSEGKGRPRFVPRVEALETREVPAAIRNLPGFLVNNLPANDDGSTGVLNLGFTINFFGVISNTVFANNNGNITITAPLSTFTPFGLTGNIGTPIIAPFFADVDTRGTGSGILTYGPDVLCGFRCFGFNWINVGYFDSHVDKLNAFQLILIERPDTGPGNFDIEFNYDRIQWETGDASGGSGGLGGSSARVGYSNGTGAPGTFFELTGSGVNGAFLDGGPNALSTNLLLASTPGRYHFLVRNGLVSQELGANTEITEAVRTFRPFRYIFDPVTNSFRGNLTVLNVGGRISTVGGNACLDLQVSGALAAGAFVSPITVVFQELPPGVSVLNASGFTGGGKPFITVNVGGFPRNRPLRLQMVVDNPNLQFLSTYTQGLSIRVFAGPFDPTSV